MTAALPANMRNKIAEEICPIAGLPGFCWAWTGAINSRGYGCIGINGKSQLSHRVAYELLVGAIPAGLQIDHLCRNKKCCNPSHLEPVTAKVNSSRTDQAEKTHCVNGHPLTGANLIVRPYGDRGLVKRNCRTCKNQGQRQWRARVKAVAA